MSLAQTQHRGAVFHALAFKGPEKAQTDRFKLFYEVYFAYVTRHS